MVYNKVSSNDSKCKNIICGRSLIINPNILENGSPNTIEDEDIDMLNYEYLLKLAGSVTYIIDRFGLI